MGEFQKIDFDLSSEIPVNNNFRSSFARSVAFEYKNHSKSLDYSYLDNTPINEEVENDFRSSGPHSLASEINISSYKKYRSTTEVKTSETKNTVLSGRYRNDALKFWKAKKEAVRSECIVKENNSASAVVDETVHARKEILDDNWKLCAPPGPVTDTTMLQNQVETLSWQLRQVEQSREMYREVMGQVIKFLERAHRSLDTKNIDNLACRVPRSRSVHTVDTSPSRMSSNTDFPRTRSVAQMEGTQTQCAFRDFTWRRSRKIYCNADEVPPEKLAEEAFRLLRMTQSLMNAREPELGQHIRQTRSTLKRSSSDASDELCSSFQRRFNLYCIDGSNCSSPAQTSDTGHRKSVDTLSIQSVSSKTQLTNLISPPLTSGLEATFAGSIQNSSIKSASPFSVSSANKMGSTSSTVGTVEPGLSQSDLSNISRPQTQLSEDESGFSSMNSFQDVGLPQESPYKAEGNFQEIGLPLTETVGRNAKHRRWSSSPVEAAFTHRNASFGSQTSTLSVLWV